MDPYKILGAPQDATDEEIRSAYREAARKHHPDMGGDAWAFQQVKEAYEKIVQTRGVKSRAGTNRPRDAQQSPTPQPAASESVGENRSPEQASAAPQPVPPSLWLRRAFIEQLPLQNETTTFILVNALDIFMTYVLMLLGGIEANPIAGYFFRRWNIAGLVFFKMGMVAFVTVVAQIIAHYRLQTARRLLLFGTAVVGIVVAYSIALIFGRLRVF